MSVAAAPLAAAFSSIKSSLADSLKSVRLGFFAGLLAVLLAVLLSFRPAPSRRARRGSTGTPPRSISPANGKRAVFSNPFRWSAASAARPAPPDAAAGKDVVTDRTPAQIAAYGDFPDYAALSGVRLPVPYTGFDITRALPRPFRPFRWNYIQTMTMKPLEPDWWIELENTYEQRIVQRRELFAKHGSSVLDALPGSEPACKELMEMVLTFLVHRYPMYFSLVKPDVFRNKILGTETNLKQKHPLHVLLENVPEDFAITLKNHETGLYEFRAGVVCSALGWSVATKIGKCLDAIHEPIPDYKENMAKHMNHYFSRMVPRNAIQRGSWGLEHGQPLFLGPDDPALSIRAQQDPSLQLSDVFLRVDWQTLRRLPLSGAIVFNFKAVFTPITEFRDEPCIPELVAKILVDGKKNLMEYKGTYHVEHVALPVLQKWAREQKENGLVDKEWEPETLGKISPYFEGWKEKWERLQGFPGVWGPSAKR